MWGWHCGPRNIRRRSGLESHGGQTVGGQKDTVGMLKKCNGNLQDGMNIGQRIDSLKGRQVRTFMDNNRCLYSAVLARMAEKSPCVISAMGE
jgi:hypothetical protein